LLSASLSETQSIAWNIFAYRENGKHPIK